MKDARGDVLYVGKAQSLRNRVRSVLAEAGAGRRDPPHPERHRPRRRRRVHRPTRSREALLLEANLIKRFQPRFNVRLKDDKSYPYIKVTLGDDFPRIERTRKLPNDGSRYFGPYASASSVDESMNLVRRLFPFRTCTIDIKDGERALQRPCLLYHIKRCQGPCIEAISKDDYRADIEQVELFLEGRQETLVKALRAGDGGRRGADRLRARRRRCATRSARSSGRWRARRWPPSRGPSSTCVGLARQDNQAAVQLFVIRDGKMIGRDVFLLEAAREATDDEVAVQLPRAVLRARRLDPARGLRAGADRRRRRRSRRSWPSAAAGRSSSASRSAARSASCWRSPTRNAAETLAREQARWLADQGKTLAALEELAEALGLPGPPLRIECYDISNFQGSESVGSMVVFEDGKPRSGRVPPLPDQDRRGAERLRQPPGGPAPPVPPAPGRRGGRRGGAPLGDARPRHHRRRQGPGQRGARRSSTSSACTTCRWPAWPRSARSCSSRPGRPDRPARDLAGALPRPAPPRRGAPVRDHLPPRAAGAAGPSAPPSTTCPASGRSASASCSRSSARSSASARRRSSRSRPCRASAARSRRGSRRRSRPDPRVGLRAFFIFTLLPMRMYGTR